MGVFFILYFLYRLDLGKICTLRQIMSIHKTIPMIDLPRVHSTYKEELDESIGFVVNSGTYIGGSVVEEFQASLTDYLGTPTFGVGNGTDALQIALMALGIGPGDEVIVPAFTYASSAEVIGLLGATAVWCDVHTSSFNLDAESVKLALSENTKAIIAVHLYGQLADLEALDQVAGSIPIVEDTAQAFGAKFTQGKYKGKYAGTVGAFGTLSFFPTKPLGAMGDGGAIISSNSVLHDSALNISRHGQSKKYIHEEIGVNSRLDSIQAAILGVKFKHFLPTLERKKRLAELYHLELIEVHQLKLPAVEHYSTHVWHQFTIRVDSNHRNFLKKYLAEKGVSTMVYYPFALSDQEAYASMIERVPISNSRSLCNEVLSLPIDPSMDDADVRIICNTIKQYFAI
ncbi:MAG TPA: hypothetical protein DIT65_05050 [Cryomorphaceae bacterium]|nr:hypothetical protein [Cryomorphaceae bacterium]